MSHEIAAEEMLAEARMIVSTLWRWGETAKLEQLARAVHLAVNRPYDYRSLRELADEDDNVGL